MLPEEDNAAVAAAIPSDDDLTFFSDLDEEEDQKEQAVNVKQKIQPTTADNASLNSKKTAELKKYESSSEIVENILDHRFSSNGSDEFRLKWVNEKGEDLQWYAVDDIDSFSNEAIRRFKILKYGSLIKAEEMAVAAAAARKKKTPPSAPSVTTTKKRSHQSNSNKDYGGVLKKKKAVDEASDTTATTTSRGHRVVARKTIVFVQSKNNSLSTLNPATEQSPKTTIGATKTKKEREEEIKDIVLGRTPRYHPSSSSSSSLTKQQGVKNVAARAATSTSRTTTRSMDAPRKRKSPTRNINETQKAGSTGNTTQKKKSPSKKLKRNSTTIKEEGKILSRDEDDNEPFYEVEAVIDHCKQGKFDYYRLSWVDVAEEDFMWYPVYQLNDETRASAEQFKKEKEKKRREGVVDEKEQDDEENFVLPAVTYSSTSANSTVRKGLVNGKDRKGNFIYDVEDILEYRKIGGVDKYRLQFANVVKERRCWYAESSLRGATKELARQFKEKVLKQERCADVKDERANTADEQPHEDETEVTEETVESEEASSTALPDIAAGAEEIEISHSRPNSSLALNQLRALLACSRCRIPFQADGITSSTPVVSRGCLHSICMGCLRKQWTKDQKEEWIRCPQCLSENCFSNSEDYPNHKNNEIIDLIKSLERRMMPIS